MLAPFYLIKSNNCLKLWPKICFANVKPLGMGKLDLGTVISKMKACLKVAKTTKDQSKGKKITSKVKEALQELQKLEQDSS